MKQNQILIFLSLLILSCTTQKQESSIPEQTLFPNYGYWTAVYDPVNTIGFRFKL